MTLETPVFQQSKDSDFVMSNESAAASFPTQIPIDRKVKLKFNATANKPLGKVGLWVTLMDLKDSRVLYTSYFYSGKDSFKVGDLLEQEITWKLPPRMPNSEYRIRIAIRDWYQPATLVYGLLQTIMTVQESV